MIKHLWIILGIAVLMEAFVYWIAYKNGDTKREDKENETDSTKF